VSSFDGQDLFGSGPHSIRPDGWERQLQRRGFAGVDGELVLDLGLRSRAIQQTGRLQGASAAAVAALVAAIEAYQDGQVHELTDDHGRTYSSAILEQFQATTPIRRGRGYWCDYAAVYRQLP